MNRRPTRLVSLEQLGFQGFFSLSVLVLGFALSWYSLSAGGGYAGVVDPRTGS